MKLIIWTLFILFNLLPIFAQSDVEKIIATEKAFAKTAAEKNTKTAFLEFAADDAVNFNPNPVNAKELWNSKEPNSALLAWTPEFADISVNGVLGYTTGPWEFRPKGKDDAPTVFGHFVTVWQKQSDGNYKFVLDIGVDHSQVSLAEKWETSKISGNSTTEFRAADAARQFFETAEKNGLDKAYKIYLAEDVRLYRQGKPPILGVKNALDEIRKNNYKIKSARRSIFVSAQTLAYFTNAYTFLDKNGKEVENGNFLQIWKVQNGNWKIVLDLFKPNPKK